MSSPSLHPHISLWTYFTVDIFPGPNIFLSQAPLHFRSQWLLKLSTFSPAFFTRQWIPRAIFLLAFHSDSMIYANIFTRNKSWVQIPSTTANMKWCEYRQKLTSEVSKHTPVLMLMMLLQRQIITLERTTLSEVKGCWFKRLFWNQAMLTANMACDTVAKVI